MSPGWMSGYGRQPPRKPPGAPPSAPPPSDPPPGWRKGQSRMQIEVMCCPECGSRYVRIRTPRGERVVLMECRSCGHDWRDTRGERIG